MAEPFRKHPGGRPKKNQSCDTTGYRTLKSLGISKDQSSQWQKLAEIPEEVFEACLRDRTKKVTTAGLVRLAKRLREREMATAPSDGVS